MTATRTGQARAQAAGPIGVPAGVSRPARAPAGPAPRSSVSGAAWPVSYGLFAGFTAFAVVTALTVVFDGSRHPALSLAAFAVTAALVSMCTRTPAAPGVALLAWMFDDGFLIHRHAVLAWPGSAGAWRLALLAGVATAGAAFGAWNRYHPPGPLPDGGFPVADGLPEDGAPAAGLSPDGGTPAADGLPEDGAPAADGLPAGGAPAAGLAPDGGLSPDGRPTLPAHPAQHWRARECATPPGEAH